MKAGLKAGHETRDTRRSELCQNIFFQGDKSEYEVVRRTDGVEAKYSTTVTAPGRHISDYYAVAFAAFLFLVNSSCLEWLH